jgi:hypothetical protein
MFFTQDNQPKCKVVKKVTDRETFRCLKPATVVLIHNTPEPIVLCMDCARELVKEIVDSVPGGRRDATRKIQELSQRGVR